MEMTQTSINTTGREPVSEPPGQTLGSRPGFGSLARRSCVMWMYAAALAHILVGMILPWIGHRPEIDNYLADAARALGSADGRAVQAWWIALFGPTLQSFGLWMLALVWFGERRREAGAWLWLIAGLLLWAPQDMLVSLRADAWLNVWVDLITLALLLPPLAWLWRIDRR
jgi:hypothetical protein